MNLFGRDGIEHVDLAPERQRELAGLLPAGHPHVRPGAGDVDGVGRDVLDHAAHAGPGGGAVVQGLGLVPDVGAFHGVAAGVPGAVLVAGDRLGEVQVVRVGVHWVGSIPAAQGGVRRITRRGRPELRGGAGGTLTTAAGRRTKASIFFLFCGRERTEGEKRGKGMAEFVGGKGEEDGFEGLRMMMIFLKRGLILKNCENESVEGWCSLCVF